MKKEYIIAYDCGTTALKTVLIRTDGTVIGDSRASNPLVQKEPGWAELNPDMIWENICLTTKEVVKNNEIEPKSVIGLVFVAHWKNIIPVDNKGKILYNSIIWMDARAAQQAERLNNEAGFFVGTGQEYWPRLMWLKENEPEIWAKTNRIMGLNTYLKWKSTGAFVTEPSDDFIHSYNPDMQEYYDKILKASGLDEDIDKFPEIQDATSEAGKLNENSAGELGLLPGISVFGGFGDLPAITVGTGCCGENMVHIYMGTSSWLVQMARERIENYSPQWFTFDKNYEGAMFSLQTGCMAFDWALEQFYNGERKLLGDDVFDFVNRQVEEIEPGSEGLLATHWLTGELPPLAKNAKGLFLNITSAHDRRHMVRAIMESVCYTHRNYMKRYEEKNGLKLSSVRVVGGGAVSDVWMQMMADILQVKIEIPESPRYTGAMGAYYCAMVGLGKIENYDAVYEAVKISKTFNPRSEYAKTYEKLFNVYTKLYPALSGLYDELNGKY
ncbi:MAG: xylulokinase [Anaerovoracaceae bacterium]